MLARRECIDRDWYSDCFCSYLRLVYPLADSDDFLADGDLRGSPRKFSHVGVIQLLLKMPQNRSRGHPTEKKDDFWPFFEGVVDFGVNFWGPNCRNMNPPWNKLWSGMYKGIFRALGCKGSDQPGQRYTVKRDIFKVATFGVNFLLARTCPIETPLVLG